MKNIQNIRNINFICTGTKYQGSDPLYIAEQSSEASDAMPGILDDSRRAIDSAVPVHEL